MITSNKQDEAAKKQLVMLTESLSAPVKKGIPDEIEQASRAQTQELIDEIQEAINEHHALSLPLPQRSRVRR